LKTSLEKTLPAQFLGQLLVATDGSDGGERAVSFAIALARCYGSQLEFCFAVNHAAVVAECCTPEGASGEAIVALEKDLDNAAAAVLAKARDEAKFAGIVATIGLLDGPSVDAIVDCEREHRFDAVVLGTEGKHGLKRLFLGSTADGVLRRTDVPAFIVPPGATGVPTFERILVAVDDSDPSDAAIEFALTFAAEDKASIVFCAVADTDGWLGTPASHTYDPTPMRNELAAGAAALLVAPAQRARKAGITFEQVVALGDPASELLKQAATHGAELIVMGTHGRRGLRRWFVGSVAENIVSSSKVPVVVMRRASSDRTRHKKNGQST